mmetsp:Transcript_141573/g.440109  ORF Transcript_141573/g.440109 Transcript_141573/m.440109 type:complete len:227 (-) Transcript_141573:398-1078(-)
MMAELLLEVRLDFLPDGGLRTEDALLRARYGVRCIAGCLRDLAMCQPARQGMAAIEPAVVAGGVPAARACDKASQWPNALALPAALPQSCLTPEVITYTTAISACEKDGPGQRALALPAALPQSLLSPFARRHHVQRGNQCVREGRPGAAQPCAFCGFAAEPHCARRHHLQRGSDSTFQRDGRQLRLVGELRGRWRAASGSGSAGPASHVGCAPGVPPAALIFQKE